jgi:DNA-binding NtrC family response regulator
VALQQWDTALDGVRDVLTLRSAKRAFVREYAREALEACGGNVTAAAWWLGITRTYLHKLIKEKGGAQDTPPALEATADACASPS